MSYDIVIPMPETILVVEDEPALRDTLSYNLKKDGFSVETVGDGRAAIDSARMLKPDLIVLDLMLPEIDGFEVCRILRKEMTTPILMLTARDDEIDRVVGLEVGADDYLTKPFSSRDLLARVSAIIRRTDRPDLQSPIYDDGVLVIDPWMFSVRHEGREVRLTRKEMRLLEELARNEGRVMMREVLLDRICGLRDYADSRTLDVHIRRLRTKLGNPNLIETITGVGYRLVGSRTKQV